MQNLIATTFEVVHYIALQTVHYKPLQEVHLSRYNQSNGGLNNYKWLDFKKNWEKWGWGVYLTSEL